MKTLLCVMLLVGCGGESFSPELFHAIPGDTGGSPEADAGTGGATSSGGALATGGETALETGGTTSTNDAGTGGVVATGGETATGGATTCTLVTHDNGLGQTWQDCIPLGTFTQEQAVKACLAAGSAQCYSLTGCGIPYYEVRGYNAGGSAIGFWMYGGPTAGHVNPASCGSAPCVLTACTVTWN